MNEKLAKLRELSPAEQERIFAFLEGPKDGEDDNAHQRRCNAFLTERDREWIVQFMLGVKGIE